MKITGTLGSLAWKHADAVNALAATDAVVLSGSEDGFARLWDARTGDEEASLEREGSIRAVALASGRAVLAGEHPLTLWDFTSARTLDPRPATCVALSSNGKGVLVGRADGTFSLHDLATGGEILARAAHGVVHAVAFDGARGVTAGEDGTVKSWDLATGRTLATLEGHEGPVHALAVEQGRAFSGGADGTVRVWDLRLGTPVRALTAHEGRVTALAPTLSVGWDGRLIAWDVAAGTHRVIGRRREPLLAVARSTAGTFTGGWDDVVTRWETEEALPGHSGWVFAVAFTPDGAQAVTAGDDGRLLVWDVASRSLLRALAGHEGAVFSVAVAGARVVSTGADRTLRAWDLASGRLLATHSTTHRLDVSAVALSPDGTRALTAGDDRLIKHHELATGRELRTYYGHVDEVKAVAFAADGHAVSCGADNAVKHWDLATGKVLRSFEEHEDTVNALAVEGTRVVSGSDDGTVRLVDLATGRAWTRVARGAVNGVAFAGGRVLAVGEAIELLDPETGAREEVPFAGDEGLSVAVHGARALVGTARGVGLVVDDVVPLTPALSPPGRGRGPG